MLVESSGGSVPGLRLPASWRPDAECVGYTAWWVAADLAGADVAVVVKTFGDGLELGLERGFARFELFGPVPAAVDAVELAGKK